MYSSTTCIEYIDSVVDVSFVVLDPETETEMKTTQSRDGAPTKHEPMERPASADVIRTKRELDDSGPSHSMSAELEERLASFGMGSGYWRDVLQKSGVTSLEHLQQSDQEKREVLESRCSGEKEREQLRAFLDFDTISTQDGVALSDANRSDEATTSIEDQLNTEKG